jgi:OFA family oxalate/formate antiporter-like MFS transporter
VVRSASPGERWLVLAAGFVVMSTAGTAFSWSLYTRPLIALFGWSSIQVALGFSLLIVFLAGGAILGGFAHDRFGPRMVAVAGAILWGAGSILAGLGIERFGLWWLYLTYSAIGGIGCGMVYVVPGAAVTKWFPEERGLANGILLCGFGLGSLGFNLIVTAFPAFRMVADAANRFVETRNAGTAIGHAFVMTPALDHAGIAVIAGVFFWSGLAFLIVGGLSALQLHSPPAGFSIASAAAKIADERDFKPREMLRTRAFYVIWVIMFVNATCGFALFSNAIPIYAKAVGLTAAIATVIFGWLSSANGVGRFLWAWVSDFIGRRQSIAICFVLQGVALFWIGHANGAIAADIAFAVTMLCFGGIFAIAPAVMADFYGTRFLGEDYSFIITAAAAAGVLGPLLVAGLEDATGSLTAWLTPVAIVVALSAAIPFLATKPRLP